MSEIPAKTRRLQPVSFISFTRRGGLVTRFHSVPTVRPNTVAEHSFGVACLLLAITEGYASADLIKAGLFHDLHECVLGDIPANTKHNFPKLKAHLEEIEEGVDKDNNVYVDLSLAERSLLHQADKLDMLFYIVEERERGNIGLDSVYAKVSGWLRGMSDVHVNTSILMADLDRRTLPFWSFNGR